MIHEMLSIRAKCPARDKMLVEKVYCPKRTLFRQGQDDCGEQSRTMQGLHPFRAFLSCVSHIIGRYPMLSIQGLRPYLPVNDSSFIIRNSSFVIHSVDPRDVQVNRF